MLIWSPKPYDPWLARCLGWTCSEHSNRGLEEPVGLASGIPGKAWATHGARCTQVTIGYPRGSHAE